MKFTKQEARSILKVAKGATKDELEKKYDILLKKYRVMKLDGTLDEKAQTDFDNCTEAYRILMGYEVDEPKTIKKETYADKAFEKAGIDKKKADNFFYYYKFHILIGIVALIVIILTVHSFVTRVEPDVTIGLMGEVNQQEFDLFKAKISKNIPEIKEVAFDSAMLSDRYQDAQSAAYMQKAMVLLAASDIKVYIVSKYVYNTYAPNGAFTDLEGIAGKLDIDVSNSENLKLRVVDEWEEPTDPTAKSKPKTYVDAEPRLYGIDVTDCDFFKDLNIVGPEKILVVRPEAEKDELVLKLIKLFTKK